MTRYILKRLFHLLLVLLAISLLAFVLLFLAGDPVSLMAAETATLEDIEALKRRLGLDQPWYVQYVNYLGQLLQGDFGNSIRQQRPVLELVLERMPATLQLTVTAQLLSIAIALPIGILSAVRHNSVFDQLAMGGAVLAQAIPIFWLGIMLILLFSVNLRWTPVAGRDGPISLVLPVITLSAIYLARNARLIRASLLEVLRADFIRTARSKGMREQRVVLRHALRNALIPVVTLLGLQFSNLLSGAVVTEMVFAWPGAGRLVVQAVLARDVPLVLGAVVIIASFVVLVNLLVDISYGLIDPRVRASS